MRYGGKSAIIPPSPIHHIYKDVCNADSYKKFPKSHIALVWKEADCDPYLIAKAAEDAGAAALILYNPPEAKYLSNARVRIVEWTEGDRLIQIPVLSMTHSVGVALASMKDATISVATNTSLEVLETFNVLCDTKRGDPHNVIVVGAHLDGVPAGPGIVDNGSGSATLLEVAIQFYRSRRIRKIENKIRFAWWGAEEVGLLGSRHYVRSLKEGDHKDRRDLQRIAANLNYDMLASPNGRVGIHDGKTAPANVQASSSQITHALSSYFNTTFPKSHHALAPMYAGSDFLPFLNAGIPSGGLDSGAGGIKTAEERRLYGGIAGAPYDGCYHKDCDTVENVDIDLLRIMGKVAAYGVETLAEMKNIRDWLDIHIRRR
ncbi:Leucyl aminopeptidase yscIV [Rhizophlyctis rosea]|uniref:Peptide hydrolase n=1 Tax=Rhizophlyctis rosea TaxID=64517 RepID=A0AAD5X7I5_9FUNG|nr:Leucyl aminopeptidase yscIV [Rhizophlyctis rosea]